MCIKVVDAPFLFLLWEILEHNLLPPVSQTSPVLSLVLAAAWKSALFHYILV